MSCYCFECANYQGGEKCKSLPCVAVPKERDTGFECPDYVPKQPQQICQFDSGKKFGHPRFYEILEKMAELHSRKNHDYAGTSDPLKNLKACERLELEPFMGVMVRLQDKWSRLEEFVKSKQLMVKDESVIDTLMDNAVYSVLAIILYEEQQKKND